VDGAEYLARTRQILSDLAEAEGSRFCEVGDQLGPRLVFVRDPCRLTGGATPGLAERAVVDCVEAERLTDFVSTTMAGLSAKARNGHGLDQLLASARLAGLAVAQTLPT